jgi:uncharacterized protein (TIGR02996 family)
VTPDEAFLADIVANPEDDAPRLVYADSLEDRGEPERAAFIRVQCELARLPDDDERREDLEARERALLEQHESEWLGPVRGLVNDAGFRTLASCPPLLRRLDTLSATECGISVAGLRAVVTSPHLLRLRVLHLNECGLRGEEGVRPLADSPQLVRLTDLSLRENALGDRGVRVLAASANCGRLASLDLAGCGVTDAGAEALARSPQVGRLEWLYLYENRLTQRGVRALAYSRGLAGLREVWLWDNRIGDADKGWLKARFGDRVRL